MWCFRKYGRNIDNGRLTRMYSLSTGQLRQVGLTQSTACTSPSTAQVCTAMQCRIPLAMGPLGGCQGCPNGWTIGSGFELDASDVCQRYIMWITMSANLAPMVNTKPQLAKQHVPHALLAQEARVRQVHKACPMDVQIVKAGEYQDETGKTDMYRLCYW